MLIWTLAVMQKLDPTDPLLRGNGAGKMANYLYYGDRLGMIASL
jgi:hypothetical protein